MSATTKRWQDKGWTYYGSENTDVARTFRRIRKQLKEAEAAKKPASNVKPMPAKKGTK